MNEQAWVFVGLPSPKSRLTLICWKLKDFVSVLVCDWMKRLIDWFSRVFSCSLLFSCCSCSCWQVCSSFIVLHSFGSSMSTFAALSLTLTLTLTHQLNHNHANKQCHVFFRRWEEIKFIIASTYIYISKQRIIQRKVFLVHKILCMIDKRSQRRIMPCLKTFFGSING